MKTVMADKEDEASGLDVFIYKGILISLVGEPAILSSNLATTFGILDDPELVARKIASHEIHGLSTALAGEALFIFIYFCSLNHFFIYILNFTFK